jgi:hypothetical protein
MIHQFKKSLQHEREQANEADKFYVEVLHATNIERYNTDSEADMEKQRKDIDVQVTIKGTKFNVSEKFRDKDYGDLYIEVYSKYPHTFGWMHSGSPDAIVYFTPASVYWITHKSLNKFCKNILFPAIPDLWYKEIYDSHQSIMSKKLKLNNIITNVQIIQAHNFEGKPWETIGVSLKFDVLERFGVKFKKH